MSRETTEHSRAPPPALQAGDCLFLDLDGTLLELRDDPGDIRPDAVLRDLLTECARQLGGALAIVSGRRLSVIDACFWPTRFSAAGLHGLERRDFYGMTRDASLDRARLQEAATVLARAMEGLPMTILEDKGASLALHWRRAPGHEAALRRLAAQALAAVGPDYHLLDGNCVVELLPRAASKGDAVRTFLQEAPFQGRRPVMVGDDITDLSAFKAVAAHGGIGVAVGERVAADAHLTDVRAVRAWLGGLRRG